MQTIQSRLYLNVVLTAIAVLLAVLAVRPYLSVSTPAYAQGFGDDGATSAQARKIAQVESAQYIEMAAALDGIGDANREIARAIKEASKSQKDIAKAIVKLGQTP